MTEFMRILKMNPHHDASGLFAKTPASGPGSKASEFTTQQVVKKLTKDHSGAFKALHDGENGITIMYEASTSGLGHAKLGDFANGRMATALRKSEGVQLKPKGSVAELKQKGKSGFPVYSQNFAVFIASKN